MSFPPTGSLTGTPGLAGPYPSLIKEDLRFDYGN